MATGKPSPHFRLPSSLPGLDARGVAVAVDGEVVPRAAWQTFALAADSCVEVLTAMQGG